MVAHANRRRCPDALSKFGNVAVSTGLGRIDRGISHTTLQMIYGFIWYVAISKRFPTENHCFGQTTYNLKNPHRLFSFCILTSESVQVREFPNSLHVSIGEEYDFEELCTINFDGLRTVQYIRQARPTNRTIRTKVVRIWPVDKNHPFNFIFSIQDWNPLKHWMHNI